MRYLIIESNWTAMALAQDLAREGVLLTRSDQPEDVMHYLRDGVQDLVLIPEDALDDYGLSLTAICNAAPGTPICVLADRPSTKACAQWLNMGAASVVNSRDKPRLVASQLSAVARRAHGVATPDLTLGALRIDLEQHRAELAGKPLRLSRKVYGVLECLALRAGNLVTRDTLMSHIYGLENEPDARVFDVYLCKLRAELARCKSGVVIQTVRGKGFRLEEVAPVPQEKTNLAA